MGGQFAGHLATIDSLTPRQQIEIHLSSNFYPPIPVSVAQPCLDAIEAYWEDELDRKIELPEGMTWRGQNTAPAHAIIEQHRLYPWVQEDEVEE